MRTSVAGFGSGAFYHQEARVGGHSTGVVTELTVDRLAVRQGVLLAAAGVEAGSEAPAGRAACAAAPAGRFRLGDATGRFGADASGVGSSIRGSGVESGIVSATLAAGDAAGEPPTVTTTNGIEGSTE
jgi:hypothetical protein